MVITDSIFREAEVLRGMGILADLEGRVVMVPIHEERSTQENPENEQRGYVIGDQVGEVMVVLGRAGLGDQMLVT